MALEDTLAKAESATTPAVTPAETTSSGNPAVTTTAEIDPDDADVIAARAEADKVDALAATPAVVTLTTPAQPQGAAPAAEDPDQVAIPKWRFDQALHKEREANAKLQGENEALKLMMGPKSGTGTSPGATATPAKTADEQLKDIKDARKAIAKKFDDGEISRLQEAEELEALSDREYAVRHEQWKAQNVPAKIESPDMGDDMRLDELTTQLAVQHKYVDHLTQSQLDYLAAEATRQLTQEGVKFGSGNLPSPQRFILRERIARLSDSYGPAMTGKTPEQLAPTPPVTPTTPPAPSNGRGPALSPAAQARDAKLDLARNAPPNLSNISGTPGSTEATDDQIAMMDDDAIAALPKATRNRILGLPA